MAGDGEVLSSVEKFSPNTGEWKTVASLRKGRYSAGVTTFRGKIYLFGGRDEAEQLNSVECYDPSTDNWEEIVKLEVPRSHFRACVVKETIFLVGGNWEPSIDVYNPAKEKQKKIAEIDGEIAPAATIVFHC